jgi:hypothetical protein
VLSGPKLTRPNSRVNFVEDRVSPVMLREQSNDRLSHDSSGSDPIIKSPLQNSSDMQLNRARTTNSKLAQSSSLAALKKGPSVTNLKSMIRVVSMQQMMSAKKKKENSVPNLDKHFFGIREITDRIKAENSKLG